jgi:CheY-like chemotaxis protein
LNLVVNSRDAMPGGGRLMIETKNVEIIGTAAESDPRQRPGHYVGLRVSDTGIGMDKETLSHIFEPFFTTKGLAKGTGLGLATVYGIVNQSDGQISVQSEPGHGTTFDILLPLVKEVVSEVIAPAPRITGGTETILLVEDSSDLRSVVRQFLEIDGYTVLGAADANEAMRVAAHHSGPIHLILTDVVLPGASGRILAESLQVTRPEAKVLFMSGYTDDTVLFHQLAKASLNFIQKPFKRANLANKVRYVLDETKVPTVIPGSLLPV